ncbi:MAG: flagellar hook-length control protein FliK [Candidatus Melainabacteria bacterium]|nr:flagellar hook-length control protein FliK [Candidatus Melainabacteria bacterium]
MQPLNPTPTATSQAQVAAKASLPGKQVLMVTAEDWDLSFLSLLESLDKASENSRNAPASGSASVANREDKLALAGYNAPEFIHNKRLKEPSDSSAGAVAAPTADDATVSSDTPPLSLTTEDLNPLDEKLLRWLLNPSGEALGQVPPPVQMMLQQVVSSVADSAEEGAQAARLARLAFSEKFSATLKEAYRTGQPIRVDLDGRSAVVLRLHRGKVSAEFVGGSAAQYSLQSQLDELKQRLSAKNLPVGDLTQREQSSRQPSQQNNSQSSSELPEEEKTTSTSAYSSL